MKAAELNTFYSDRKAAYDNHLKKVNRRIKAISNARIVTAVVFLGLLYFGFRDTTFLYILPVLLVLFVYLVKLHVTAYTEQALSQNLSAIQENEMKSLGGKWTGFYPGAEFIDTRHRFSHDLDLFGEGSLFQFLNRSATLGGRARLAKQMTSASSLTRDEVVLTQQAVAEVAEKADWRHRIQAQGMLVREHSNDRDELARWSELPPVLSPIPFYRAVLTVLPLLAIGTLALSFVVEGVIGFFWLLVFLQWAFVGYHLKRVALFQDYVSRKKSILDNYSAMIRAITQEKFGTAKLHGIASRLAEADLHLKKLSSLVYALDARSNFMTAVVANGLLAYDLQVVLRLEDWKQRHGRHLTLWLDTVAEVESLCSMGNFKFSYAAYTSFPIISEGNEFSAEEMAHPLIQVAESVSNTVSMDAEQSILIITGPNMAGKSTFLRTIGVNVVLAEIGAPVMAKSMRCPLTPLFTGMRTADSLKDHASYFYAELNRLKSIVDQLHQGQRLFVLLDEILKGTNSNDKQAGSIALVEQLVSLPCLAVIATHDLALGALETQHQGRVANYCFEAEIINDELHFDYKLKRGIATKMNATFLMKKMGIIAG